jgi:hypothetical protein
MAIMNGAVMGAGSLWPSLGTYITGFLLCQSIVNIHTIKKKPLTSLNWLGFMCKSVVCFFNILRGPGSPTHCENLGQDLYCLLSIRNCGGISENETPALASIPFFEMIHVTFLQ